jgi:H+/Cl- antiporter ClcA
VGVAADGVTFFVGSLPFTAAASLLYLQVTNASRVTAGVRAPGRRRILLTSAWPLPLSALAGLLVGLTIRYLPGRGGESPADGFVPGRGSPSPIDLPDIFLAALAGLSLGVVIGPEAPLIALGGGLGVCAMRLASRDVPPRTRP